VLLQLREASSEAEGCVSFIRKSVDIIANTRAYIVDQPQACLGLRHATVTSDHGLSVLPN